MKKNILIGSFVGIVLAYIFANPVFFHICVNTYTFGDNIGCFDKISELISLLLVGISSSLLLLSIITYRMKDEVFHAWWSFARWWVLLIIIVTLWIETAGGGGGWGMNGGAFDAFFIGIFYFVFVVVSLFKIVRTYLRTKNN